MPELTISADEIAAALRKHVESFEPSVESARVGRVLEVGDGIARVAGLPETSVNELLEFEGGTLGLALNLDEDSIGAVILGQSDQVEEGHSGQGDGPDPLGARRRRAHRARRERARPGHRRQGPDRVHRGPPPRGAGAGHRRPPAGARAAPDRHQGHRRDDARSAAASAS